MLVMKQALLACVQASMCAHRSQDNGAFELVRVHMCRVVNLCQLCVAALLTSDHCVMEPMWMFDCGNGAGGVGWGAFQELGPLSMITLIKTAVCNN